MRGVEVQLHAQAARLARYRSGRRHGEVVGDNHLFNVAFEFQHRLGFQVCLLRSTARLFNQIGAARCADYLAENLAMVAYALGCNLCLQCGIVTVNHGIVSVCCGQAVTLPFVECSSRCDAASSGHDRRFGRRGLEDFVNQILAVTFEGIFLIQICWDCCHLIFSGYRRNAAKSFNLARPVLKRLSSSLSRRSCAGGVCLVGMRGAACAFAITAGFWACNAR